MKKIKILIIFLAVSGAVTLSFATMPETNTQLDLNNIYKDNLTYINTVTPENSSSNEIPTIEIYVDTDNNEFIYNKNGIAAYRLYPNEKKKAINLFRKSLDVKKISNNYLKNIVNIEEYKMEPIKYITSEKVYDLTYYKYIQNIKTADFISLFINEDGTIVSYMAPNIDVFKNINVPIIYENNINQKIYNKLIDIYKDTLISYSISDKYLILIDNKVVLRCYLDITLDNNNVISNIQDIEIN